MHVLVQHRDPLTLILSFGGDQTTHTALPGESEAELWERVVGLQVIGMRDAGCAGNHVAMVMRPACHLFQCRAYLNAHGTRSYALNDTLRLLLMACSATKRPDPGLLSAFARYDGPSFRTVRKWCAAHPNEARRLDILIVSAKYGLLSAFHSEIADYDQRMTADRARELIPSIVNGLVSGLAHNPYSSMLVHLGQDYLPVLGVGLLPAPLAVSFTAGGIGERLGQLKRWLEAPFDPLAGFVPVVYRA